MTSNRTTTNTTRTPPPLLPSYARALIRGRKTQGTPSHSPLPDADPLLLDLRPDHERVRAYEQVCGFATTGHLPPTYPHVLAFPAAMHLMTRKVFPLPLLGLVHISNRISVRRPIDTTEPLTLLVHAADLRPHPSGLAFDLVAQANDQSGEIVWESTRTYLHRDLATPRRPERQTEHAPSTPLSPATGPYPPHPHGSITAEWYIPPNTGRRYAAVSGDRNPIHLHPWTARLFGFRRAIAHGMWTMARVLATLEPVLPPAYTIDVTFRAPVYLPSTVRLRTVSCANTGTGRDTDDIRLTLTPAELDAASSARPSTHLDGTVTFTP